MGQVTCQSCGHSVSDIARFCPRCGGTVASWTPPSAVGDWPPQPQPPPPQQPYQQPYQQPQPYQDPYQPTQPVYQPQPTYQQPYPPPMQPNYYLQQPLAPISYPVERKDKTAAVLLAIFLGNFAWLYTYKRDAWKFWLTFALHITIFNPLWTWILLFLPNFALYIWSIIDMAARPQEFYDQYPNR